MWYIFSYVIYYKIERLKDSSSLAVKIIIREEVNAIWGCDRDEKVDKASVELFRVLTSERRSLSRKKRFKE